MARTPGNFNEFYRLLIYGEALGGDQSFAIESMNEICARVAAGKRLDSLDAKFVASAFSRIVESKQATNALCGKSNQRGSDSRGSKSLEQARLVRQAIIDGFSVESAWEKVAASQNCSPSSVKKSWVRWKDTIDAMVIAWVDSFPGANPRKREQLISYLTEQRFIIGQLKRQRMHRQTKD